MLYPLVESALPEDTLRVWQRSVVQRATADEEQNNTKDRLKRLISFLQNEVEGEERIELALNGFGIPDQESKKEIPSLQRSRQRIREKESLDQKVICDSVAIIEKSDWVERVKNKYGVTLSDVDSTSESIDLMIGADIAGKLITGKKIEIENGPCLFETLLGWTVMGKLPTGGYKHKNATRIDWPLERIIKAFPDADGTSRVFMVKTKQGVLKRPIQRLYPLEVPTESTGLSSRLHNERKQAVIKSSKEHPIEIQNKNLIELEPENQEVKSDDSSITLMVEVGNFPNDNIQYNPGDHLGVFPCNNENMVDNILRRLENSFDFDTPIDLQIQKQVHTPNGLNFD
ncbi:hypothetical protein TKK_0017103 [Trichogramma kaykai]